MYYYFLFRFFLIFGDVLCCLLINVKKKEKISTLKQRKIGKQDFFNEFCRFSYFNNFNEILQFLYFLFSTKFNIIY